ncbi:hypothetical protein ED733_006955 [Metarhizium rileyi]|uniref:Beta-lactamase/transpeptidase-like protein n=1 Tax=Metarhizium rileyi (strain RCEF 4871) TaxID=1649241 RepID=A0A5C6GGI2_METRR|nr:hypothetical protein ED733_006955 [Metarhizium rileyi]
MMRRTVSKGAVAVAAAVVNLPAALSAQTPLSNPVPAQTNHSSPFTDDLNSYVEDLMDEWKLAGMAVAVIDGDDVFTEVRHWFAGSTTKAQLAASLAHLIESKEHPALRAGWSTRISPVIRDDFVLQDEYATEHLTLDDAVSHRTGFPSHNLALATYPNSSTPIKDANRVLWHYCNPMWQVLTHVVETVTGESLRETLKRALWDPLGMKSTFASLHGVLASGAGAVISTAKDYARWVRALLRRDGFLSEAVHEDIVRPRSVAVPVPAPDEGADVATYALGWMRTNLHGQKTMWHGALVYWLPERQYGVVVFANYPNGAPQAVTYRLIEDKLGVPQDKRIDVNAIARAAARKRKQDFANASALLFPKLPSPRLPPSVETALLAGTYRHRGYGRLTLVEAVGGALAAVRPNHIFPQQVTLEHASGDFWTALWRLRDDDPDRGDFFRARFVVGGDGEVKALEVTHRAGADGFLDGVVLYDRV